MRTCILTLAACLLLASVAGEARCEPEPEPEQESGPTSELGEGFYSFSVGESWYGDVIPDGLMYPLYVADPLRPTVSVGQMWLQNSGIPESGDSRYSFRFGARVGLLRFGPKDQSGAGIQLDAEGGWLGMFDLDERQDNIGWEGLYGFYLTAATGDGLAAQFGLKHESSHVGDEYAERTGHERLGYTRQELVLGLSYSFPVGFQVYGEGAYAYDTLNTELQEPLRFQAGVQAEKPDLFFDGKAGLYAALDLKSYEESDWNIDLTLQTGLLFAKPGHSPDWRVGLEYHNGRSILGEFYQYEEDYLLLGLWIDL